MKSWVYFFLLCEFPAYLFVIFSAIVDFNNAFEIFAINIAFLILISNLN